MPHTLPLEIWAKVFRYLKPCCRDATSGNFQEEARQVVLKAAVASQSQYYHLKLVCTKFNQAFKEVPFLSDQPISAQADSAKLLPSFEIWLKQHHASVGSLITLCGQEQQDLVFDMPSLQALCLTDLFLYQPSAHTLERVSVLTSVVTCKLTDVKGKSLIDLEALHSLQHLILITCTVREVPIASTLTCLSVQASQVECAEGLCHPQKLQELQVIASNLIGLHDTGLMACTALQKLQFGMCHIPASQPCNSLWCGPSGASAFPAGLSSHKHLTAIDALLFGDDATGAHTDWLCGLTSVKEVTLSIQGSFKLSAHLTQLTSLMSLSIDTRGRTDFSNISWQAMQKLESLEIFGPATFDKHVVDITLLPEFKFLSLCEIEPATGTAMHLSKLVKSLAVVAPHITFIFEGLPVMLQ